MCIYLYIYIYIKTHYTIIILYLTTLNRIHAYVPMAQPLHARLHSTRSLHPSPLTILVMSTKRAHVRNT